MASSPPSPSGAGPTPLPAHPSSGGVAPSGPEDAFTEALRVAGQLPKAELHLHLDGSIPPRLITRHAAARRDPAHPRHDPGFPSTPAELRSFIDAEKEKMLRGHPATGGFGGVKPGANMSVFDWMNQFLQTAEELEEAARELCRDLYSDHRVRLAEVRFCPALHTLGGLAEEEAVEAVSRGVRVAERSLVGGAGAPRFRGGVILCALRTRDSPHPLRTAQLAKSFIDRGKGESNAVVGFDIAGPETNFPLDRAALREALEFCTLHGVPVTVHAGEVRTGAVPNLKVALNEFGARRIGHGFAIVHGDVREEDSRQLLARAVELGTTFEVCQTSNIPVHVASYGDHPVRRIHDAGCRVTISCDNLTLSGWRGGSQEPYKRHSPHGSFYAWPSAEVAHLAADGGFSWAEVRQILLNGVRGCFTLSPGTDAADGEWLAEFEREVDQAMKAAGVAEL